MRVLIAAPHDVSNPYCRELGAGYRAAGCEVVYGLDLFWTGHAQVDVVHLQWPEHLAERPAGVPPDVAALVDRLARWRAHAVILATVHNAEPHDPWPHWRDLFAAVYEQCDGVVHHGRRSAEWFASAFPGLSDTPSRVIPHGAYTSYPVSLDRGTARRELGLTDTERVVLVFGRLRTTQEFALVTRGFASARIGRKCMLLPASFPVRRLATLRNVGLRLRYLARVRHVLLPSWLPPHEIQRPFLAADVLLVQRATGLNSGNVPLAFTFGLPVVTPDAGVFGEVARETGNVVFAPATAAQAALALEEAFAMDLRALGERNRRMAQREWNWTSIAGRLLEFIGQLQTRRAASRGRR